MAIVASGQLTLTDLNDAKQLVMYIGASQSRTVIYNGASTYVPDYSTASTNQVLTPQLFVAGDSTDVSQGAVGCKWFYQVNGAGSPIEITASDSTYVLTKVGTKELYSLTIKSNILKDNTTMTYICELTYPDDLTGFHVTSKAEIELVKVTNGIDGADGKDGANGKDGINGTNAIMGILTNDSHTIPTDENGAYGNYAGASTQIIVYNGSTDDTANWSVSATTSTGITGSLTGNSYKVTNMTEDTGYVELTATRSGYATITKRFALSKSRQGTTGISPTTYWLISSVPAINRSKTGAYTPSNVVFSGMSQTGVGSPMNYSGRFLIEETTDGSTYTKKYESTTNESSYTYAVSNGIKAVRVKLFLPLDSGLGGTSTLLDEQVISVVSDGNDGIDAIIGVLSNETANVPATSAGAVSSFTGAESTFSIYNGIRDDTANWTIAQSVTGGTVTASGTPANRTATFTAMSADVATVTFTATRNGFATVTKTFTVNKVKAGSNGTSPTAYNMLVSTSVLALNDLRTQYNPATITVTGRSQTGTATPANYSGRFIIDESTDGVTFGTAKYTSSANQATYTYTPSAPSTGIKAVRIRMYLANGVTTQVDEQVIRVVADGRNSIYANVWTPEGNSVRNDEGSVKVKIDLYNGTESVTATSYDWYIQDPNAAGDSDSGAGWKKLTTTDNENVTGFTTDTIVVPASAIHGTEAFKCVATYNSKKYSNVTTVVDLSDPILVRLDGMDKFKNGEGSITVKAVLLRAGLEIDASGDQGYTYNWYIYDADNSRTTFSRTGKTITVNATDIDGRGNLVCEVNKG